MNYTVVWKPAAEQELAALWNAATDRNLITAAAHQIDQTLTVNPGEAGESRPEGFRVLFVLPLGVRYKVEDEDYLVSVVAVWRPKKRDRHP